MVIAELLTGTFFLLMISLGMVAAALAAQAGAGLTLQLLVAAITGGGAVLGCYLFKKRRSAARPRLDQADMSGSLDIGETVIIEAWNPDGTASVKYRGANWTAIHRPEQAPSTGPHRVADLIGTRLLVEKIG
jgi:membrane protein implicated in regulation of membrane protease activity